MVQELFYTSAPQGLKPGSRGFCTVGSTSGMAKNLAEQLESLSGYRHVYAANDKNAAWNPVVYSHLRLVVGGKKYHLLSRICDAGLDYTKRTNKLAHHVVLDRTEAASVSGGPAWLLQHEGFMESKWEGEARILPSARQLPKGASPLRRCQKWEELTGDAGWGGCLAKTASQGANREAVIIFRPGMAVLPLIVESLNLLPPPQRWDVTFSTYFTKLPPGVTCQWRCVAEGSPEAKAARTSPHTLVIDLCSSLGNAPGSPLVQAARSGEAPAIAPSPTIAEHGEAAPPVQVAVSSATPSAEHVDASDDDLFNVGPPQVGSPTLARGRVPIQPSRRKPRKRSRWKVPAVALLGLTLVIVFAAMTAYLIPELTLARLWHREQAEKSDDSVSTQNTSAANTAPKSNTKHAMNSSDSGPDDGASDEQVDTAPSKSKDQAATSAPTEHAGDVDTQPQMPQPQHTESDQSPHIEYQALPSLSNNPAVHTGKWQHPIKMGTPETVSLLPSLGNGDGFSIPPAGSEHTSLWKLLYRDPTYHSNEFLGTFNFDTKLPGLLFDWRKTSIKEDVEAKSNNYLLKITLHDSDQPQYIALRPPPEGKPIRLSKDKQCSQTIESIPEIEPSRVFFELKPQSIDSHSFSFPPPHRIIDIPQTPIDGTDFGIFDYAIVYTNKYATEYGNDEWAKTAILAIGPSCTVTDTDKPTLKSVTLTLTVSQSINDLEGTIEQLKKELKREKEQKAPKKKLNTASGSAGNTAENDRGKEQENNDDASRIQREIDWYTDECNALKALANVDIHYRFYFEVPEPGKDPIEVDIARSWELRPDESGGEAQ